MEYQPNTTLVLGNDRMAPSVGIDVVDRKMVEEIQLVLRLCDDRNDVCQCLDTLEILRQRDVKDALVNSFVPDRMGCYGAEEVLYAALDGCHRLKTLSLALREVCALQASSLTFSDSPFSSNR